MTTIPENRKMFHIVMGFLALCLIAAIMTSCSPYTNQGDNVVTLVTPTPAPSMTATSKGNNVVTLATPTPRPTCTVTGYLNFRTGPGTRYAVNQILERGDVAQVIARRDGWLQVRTTQRVTGWVYSKYCQ